MFLISPVELTKNFRKCKQTLFEANRIFEVFILKTEYSAFLKQAFLLATYCHCLLKNFSKGNITLIKS